MAYNECRGHNSGPVLNLKMIGIHWLGEDYHQRSVSGSVNTAGVMQRARPAEKPFCLIDAHIDAPAAHGRAEVVMPVRAVKGNTRFGKEGRPGDAR